MKIFQSRSFERKVKKISAQEKGILDKEIRKIAVNLSIGDEKKETSEEYPFINLRLKQRSISLLTGLPEKIWS